MGARQKLSHPRIIEAAAAVADRAGLEGVSMRSVGKELGVEAMSLYHHIANKQQLLSDLTSWVVSQLDAIDPNAEWRSALTQRAQTILEVFRAHPWALQLVQRRRALETAQLSHVDSALGTLFAHDFGAEMAAHALSIVDSYAYGFIVSEQSIPESTAQNADSASGAVRLTHLGRLLQELQDYSYADEFAYGLDLILTGLQSRLEIAATPKPREDYWTYAQPLFL